MIANFIEEHSRGKYKRSGKEVLNKTKEMQKLDPSVKEEANKKAFEKTLQTIKIEVKVEDKPTERYASKHFDTDCKLNRFFLLNFCNCSTW